MEEDKKATQTISLSVRTLVEFVLRSGSIDQRLGGFDRAQIGSQLHRKIQKQSGPNYQPEVFMKDETVYGNALFVIQGRADGIIKNDTDVTIDEIKSTAIPLNQIDEGKTIHWAQVKCYGWFMAKKEKLKQVTLRLTYIHIETKEMKVIEQVFASEDLKGFYESLLDGWLKWVRMENCWQMDRNRSAGTIGFPYPAYRKGQREMAVAVYKTIRQKQRLFCQAPTGIGKTISVLFPTIKAMSEGLTDKIFYLTAKTMTRTAAEKALNHLRSVGAKLRSVTLTAKDKLCFLEERACNPEACPYAKGYYDRINDAVYDLLSHYDCFTREILETEGRKRELCPFELSLDLVPWCDVVIADYNYIFDPVVAITTFTENNENPVLLIDEAHNLVDRSRSMYSASIQKSPFPALKKQLNKTDKPLYQSVTKVNEAFIALRKKGKEVRYFVLDAPDRDLMDALTIFTYSFESWRKKQLTHPAAESALALYFDVRTFLLISSMAGDQYVTTVECSGSDVRVTQCCLDASEVLDQIMSKSRSAIFFSATLSPVSYFKRTLGGNDAHAIGLSSPFDQNRFRILATRGISTRYTDREGSLLSVVQMIEAFTDVHVGNYMVFFPSYAYMEDALMLFESRAGDMRILVQQSEMSEEDREGFLSAFKPDPTKTTVAFCITGGVFGEGIDLKGTRLTGVVIVGVGMPQLCRERDLLKAYYDDHGFMGFDYAYRNPGMIRVMQAMGRVIRDHEDKGMALLIDDRFGESAYRQLLPRHFQPDVFCKTAEEIKGEAERFWY